MLNRRDTDHSPPGSGVTSQEELESLGLRYRRPKVVVIDDETAVLELLGEYLDGEGYELRQFTSAFEGLDAISKLKPEVALVDLMMPGMSGLELVGSARANSPTTSFIVITGHTTIDSLLEAIRHGVHDYLTKPFGSADAVRLVVRNAVRKYGLETLLRLQATVTGTVLKLGELSCVGEGRELFFAQVRNVFRRLLDATTVASLFRVKRRLVCEIDSVSSLSLDAGDQLEALAAARFGVDPKFHKIRRTVNLLRPEISSPLVREHATLLPFAALSVDGVEAQFVVAHKMPEAFSRDAVRTALSFARNVGIIIQRQFLGASHEHRMIADLLHNLKDGVVVLDREYRVRYTNPQARRILGVKDNANPQAALERLVEIDKSLGDVKSSQSFRSALQKQIALEFEGEERFFDLAAYTFFTPAKVGYRMISFRDVTHMRKERKKIMRLNQRLKDLNDELLMRNRRLEAVNKELDAFAYIASHDLQEPFRHIEIFAQFLQQDLVGGDNLSKDVEYHLSQIGHNVDIANRLLGDLRTLSKITRMRNPHRDVSLVDMVEEVLERFETSIEEAGAQVTVADLPTVKCDPIKMKEVFHNLLSNALKYSDSEQPVIEIAAGSEGDLVNVSVTDNGVGIAPEYHDYVFQACRRIPHKNSPKGSGLGLAIVKRIVEEHGGKVWVDSELGKGASFVFQIPASQ